MEQLINDTVAFIKSSGLLGPIICCLLIVIESVIPILPLAVFIALNALFFGHVIGFILSWFFTIIGCIISYYLCKNHLRKYYEKKLAKEKNIKKFMDGFNKLSFSQLVVLIGIPFAPAFLINIVAGLNNMNIKRFIYALLIGKVSIVIFWGYIGTSFINSFKDPSVLLKIIIMLIIAYFVSKFVAKKYNIQ